MLEFLIRNAIEFSSFLSLLHALPQFCHFASIVGCFVRSAVAWAVPKLYCGAIETIIGFSLKQFYADAIEPLRGVKVRAILGPIQMRTGQYTLRQMSKPISSFGLTRGNVCLCGSEVCVLCWESWIFFYVEQMKKSEGVKCIAAAYR